MAALLDAAPEDGALLLERVEPGQPLATIVPERDDDPHGLVGDPAYELAPLL